MKKNKILLYVCVFCLSIIYPNEFGKNIVQYEDFEWYFVQTNHFDIYVSDSSGYHIDFLQKTSEEAYDKISNLLNWSLKDRVAIIVYSSHNEFQQTNVISIHLPEGVGGVTELLKNRVVIPFDGSYVEFKNVLYHELVHAFINDSVYGGSLKNMIANSIKTRIPLWMNEGLAEYIANKWNANSDMWIRDLVINGNNLPHINELDGYWAYRGGQSVWNYIAEKWGEESIAEIINQVKLTGDINSGLEKAIALDIDELTRQWHKYLKNEYWIDINNKEEIHNIASQLTFHEKLNNHYNLAPSISPNGNEIAIFSDREGIINLFLINSLDGEISKKIIQGERTLEFEELHILKPGITWSPDGEKLAVAVKSGKSDALVFINLINNKKNIKRFGLKGIFRPTWNPKSNKIAFIGNDGFSSDIYIYNLNSDSLSNITNDWFTDDQVSWDENGENLLFISNRGNHLSLEEEKHTFISFGEIQEQKIWDEKLEIHWDDKTKSFISNNEHYKAQPVDSIISNINLEQYDIYSLNINNKNIIRLTNTSFNETYPFYSNKHKALVYISDYNGINNIFIKEDGKEEIPITNILTGITQLSWSLNTNQLIFTGFNNGGYDIFTIYDPLSYLNNPVQLKNASWKNKDSNQELFRKNKEQIEENNLNKYRNYVFLDIDLKKSKTNQSSNSTINKNYSGFDVTRTFRMFQYKTRFTLDYANVDYGYNSRRGSTGLVNFVFSDILGDHKILINTEMEIRLKSSDYLIYYYNLSKRTNWMFGFYHFGIELSGVDQTDDGPIIGPIIRYQSLGIIIEPSFIINRFQRVRFGLDIKRDTKQSLDWIDYYNYNEDPDTAYTKNFLIPSIEYSFDNTLWYETYPIKGRRLSIKHINSILPNSEHIPSLNFNSITFDLRQYLKIANGISSAFRIYGGHFSGSDVNTSARFRVGGTTYLPFFNRANYHHFYDVQQFDPVYYDTYVMPLRGVPIGTKYGKNTLLMNMEVRLPFLLYYFPAVGALGKINGVIFSDLGVTWNNSFPDFKSSTSWDISDLDGYSLYPISEIENGNDFNNSRLTSSEGWVWSVGLGPRFILFGLPWQLDVAWLYNPTTKEFSSKRWYLSIGLDY